MDFSFGWVLPKDIIVDPADPIMKRLVDRYYSTDIETSHNLAGGGTSTDIKWGYKDGRLPLVLEHNTPNNSLPLIWGQTEGETGHKMELLGVASATDNRDV